MTRNRRLRWLSCVIAVGLAAAVVVGCGGGGRRRQMLPTACIAFQGMAAPAGSTVVAQQGSGSQCELVQVELLLTDVTDVQTVDFTVDFDASLAEFEGISMAGSVLTSDGANVNILQNEGPGQVDIDLSRFGSGIDFNGPGTLVRLIFSPAAGAIPGPGPLSFSSTQIFGSEAPPLEKPGIPWIGGTLQVTDN